MCIYFSTGLVLSLVVKGRSGESMSLDTGRGYSVELPVKVQYYPAHCYNILPQTMATRFHTINYLPNTYAWKQLFSAHETQLNGVLIKLNHFLSIPAIRKKLFCVLCNQIINIGLINRFMIECIILKGI